MTGLSVAVDGDASPTRDEAEVVDDVPGVWQGWTGRLLQVGLLLLLVKVIMWITIYAWSPHHALQLLEADALYLFGGREAAAFAALTPAPPPPPLLLFVGLGSGDIAAVFILLPLVVIGLRHFRHWPVVRPLLNAVERSADRNRDKVEKGGAVGLALFSIMPAWGTGPLAGSIVGVLAGMRPVVVLTATLTGALLADFLWSFFAVAVAETFSRYQLALQVIPFLILGGVITTAIVSDRRARAREGIVSIGAMPGLRRRDALRLRSRGIRHVEDILGVNAHHIARELDVPVAEVHRWQHVADLMHTGVLHVREAAALVHCGIRSEEELASAHVDHLHERVNACEETRRLLSGGVPFEDLLEAAARAARHVHQRP